MLGGFPFIVVKRRIITYPLVFAENYYIHRQGYVYYIDIKREVVPKIKNKMPFVEINGAEYNLFNLMVEYFILGKKIKSLRNKVLTYKPTKRYPLRVSVGSIKIQEKETVLLAADNIIKLFSCDKKANMANARCKETLRGDEIAHVLHEHKFKCRYCGNKINRKFWHLDHIVPLALNGKNTVDNIAPSCPMCNLMKRDYHENDFLMRCEMIVNNRKQKLT